VADALSPLTTLNDRQMRAFRDDGVDIDGNPKTKLAIDGSFSASPGGLRVGGKVTEVIINNTTWTALPLTALLNRNAIAIQNRTGQEIKVNYDNTEPGYVGIVIDDKSERFYDITDAIIIYAKSKISSCTVFVEEIA
jgi:3-dehydroquinate synthase class II